MKNLINRLSEIYDIFDFQSNESEADSSHGDFYHPIPSVLTFLLRYVFQYIFITVPVIWIALIVACIIEGLPVLGVIIVSIIATLLALIALVIIFALLFVLESFIKQLVSLIVYGEPTLYFCNIIDMYITVGLLGGFRH